MKKQDQFLPFITPILVLVPLASIVYLFPLSIKASAVSQQDQDDHVIFLPLVLNKPWPSMCYAPGTENFKVPDPEIPEITLQQGTTITVTTNADIINGNVSSVAGLLANPGPDGIALREAIEATNNDPGEYTIRFATQLDDTTIYTGGTNNQDLPPLLGGSLIINGDIDGDGTPDITIANASTFQYPFGFKIQSSNNTIHGLQMEGYFQGVLIKPTTPTTTYTTFRGITVSNMVMSNVLSGVNLHAGPDQGVQASYNRWEDILLINNDLDTEQDGITINLNNTIGDHVDNVTVANNHILVTQNIDSASFGIQFMAGFWVGSNDNVMTNINISQNTIQGNPDNAIALISGAVAASENVIDGVSILENKILITDTNFSYEAGKYGINLFTGDGGSDYIDPSYEPITYPEYNVLRNIDVIGNTIEGFVGRGIFIQGGCCGARNNTIENVNILSNQIRAQIPDVEFNVTGITVYSGGAWNDRHTADNLVSNIIVQSNTVYLGRQAVLPPIDLYPSGAISIIGGGGAPGADRNEVRHIWLSLNGVDSVIPAIHLIGGWTESTENVINTANVYCNTITRAPIYPVWEPPLKGIVLTGAISDSTLNRVENITLFYNNVASIWNDLTVIPNVESTATNNVVDYRIYP
jgi:hypothetical protein